MHLASSHPHLIKGDVLQICKGLIAAIKNNHTLVEQSSHSALPGDDNLKRHILQHGDFVYWKRHLQKDLTLSETANQLLSHQTPGKRLLDSHNTSTESTRPWLNVHTAC